MPTLGLVPTPHGQSAGGLLQFPVDLGSGRRGAEERGRERGRRSEFGVFGKRLARMHRSIAETEVDGWEEEVDGWMVECE